MLAMPKGIVKVKSLKSACRCTDRLCVVLVPSMELFVSAPCTYGHTERHQTVVFFARVKHSRVVSDVVTAASTNESASGDFICEPFEPDTSGRAKFASSQLKDTTVSVV